ncbi:MAG: hypothetical protein JAZ17_00250 [Candidatus Thiodiazotropha endolucinida]|nr:hypothetical protein [Candidatus Thiodiazotropha endolucinida]
MRKLIEINGITYDAEITEVEWGHGISVQIKILKESEMYFSSRVSSSKYASDNYPEVSKLNTDALLEGAWRQFQSFYPFEKLEEIAKSGIEVLLPWR